MCTSVLVALARYCPGYTDMPTGRSMAKCNSAYVQGFAVGTILGNFSITCPEEKVWPNIPIFGGLKTIISIGCVYPKEQVSLVTLA